MSPSAVESSWTRNELLKAEPIVPPAPPEASFDVPDFPVASVSAGTGDFPVADATAYPARLHGKVFFRIGLNEYSCSGTLVDSRNGNAIYTAGHCVYDTGTAAFVTDFAFVPGYKDGATPLGIYAATGLATTTGWVSSGDFSYDIAVATLEGTPEADLGGGRKIAFDLDPLGRAYTIYGYPADPEPRYNGERLIGCDITVTARDSGNPRTLAATPCFMGHGSSGGGWMAGGYLNSVTSYIYCESNPSFCGYIYGPYFSDAAKKLYKSSTVGGSTTPTFKVTHQPPAKVRKKKVLFKFAGEGSTPIRYKCSFDSRSYVSCGARTTISRLTPGKHVLRIQANDQTGRKAQKTLTRKFRVLKG